MKIDRPEDLDQVQAHIRSLGELAGKLSHDFGNVLEAIHSNLECLLRDPVISSRPEAKACLDDALRACLEGASLSHHLLGYARKQSYDQCALSLRELVLDVVKLCSYTFEAECEIIVDEKFVDRNPYIRGSYSSLGYSLLSILQNARAAMPNGRILVQLSLDSFFAHICVVDEGAGLNPDEVLSLNSSDPLEGDLGQYGFSMKLAKGVVEQNGGRLTVRSQAGSGTSVILSVPLDHEVLQPSTQEESGCADEGRKASLRDGARPASRRRLVRKTQSINFGQFSVGAKSDSGLEGQTAMIVDDDPLVCRGMARSLRSLGLEVLGAYLQPSEALEHLKNMIWPNWLFIDYSMPEMDGIHLIRNILLMQTQLEIDPDRVHIALMSAYPPDQLDGLLGQFEGIHFNVLTKPFSLGAIKELVTGGSTGTSKRATSAIRFQLSEDSGHRASCYFGCFE